MVHTHTHTHTHMHTHILLGIKVLPSSVSPTGSSGQNSKVATARKRPAVAATGVVPPKKVGKVQGFQLETIDSVYLSLYCLSL